MTTVPPCHLPSGLSAAILACLVLSGCQTNPVDLLTVDAAADPATVSQEMAQNGAYRDPMVSAQGKVAAKPSATLPLKESSPPRLTGHSSPMAAAYTEIAEPPPEVLAQMQGAQQPTDAAAPATADLGELTMQPTGVRAGSNSIFAAGRGAATASAPPPQPTISGSSLLPADLPTVGVQATSKSLFSPTAAAAQDEQLAPAPAVTPQIVSPGVEDEAPVLRKLSDPRPKRKILALREPTAAPTEPVEITEAQLVALDAVPQTQSETQAPTDDGPAPAAKKAWLPSLSKLLSGGKKSAAHPVSP